MDQQSNKLLTLDLDETLIDASEEKLQIVEDFKFDKYWVYKRPFVDSFLLDISQHFKIGIWSSADDAYVAGIIDYLKPQNVSFEIVWGKSRCSLCRHYELDRNYFEKKLDKLKKKGFRLEHIIVVDDSPEKSKSNYGNAVYITEFIGDNTDEELKHLYRYLLTLKDVENIRSVKKRGWRKNKNG